MWFSHWVTAARPHEKELPWRAGDICQNSARHAVGALQIFREGEGECRRVARPGSCPQRTVTSTQRKPVFCAREKNCIKACLRGGAGVGTSRPLLLHEEDAEIRGSISGAKRRLPWWAREQQRQREALRARPPPASWIGSRQRPWPPGAMTRQPDLGGAAPRLQAALSVLRGVGRAQAAGFSPGLETAPGRRPAPGRRRGPGSCCILGTVSPYFSDTLQPDRAAQTCLASLALPLPHPHTGGEGRAQV